MTKLTMTKGLPASGKTTWAKEQVLKSNGRTKRVNKDDLRAMIDNSVWSKQNEKNILAVRDYITKHYLLLGNDVIVDDTNLTPNHEKRLSEIAGETGAIFEIKSFLDVPLATCILRNAQRVNPVPETAIRSMYKSFVKPKAKIAEYVAPPYNPDLQNCIIVDIDGTVAHMNGVNPSTNTSTFTRTHASHIAGRIATDLRHSLREYKSPSESMLENYRLELEELLFNHYVSSYYFGFKRSDTNIVWAVKYSISQDGTISSDSAIAGGIPRGHDVNGAIFFNFLTYSTNWGNLTLEQRQSIKAGLAVKREDGILPGSGSEVWNDDRLFVAGNVAAQRSVVGAVS